MRERIAILVCLLVLAVALAISYLFAVRHNPIAAEVATEPRQGERASAAQTATPESAREPTPASVVQPAETETFGAELARGRVLFAQHGCASCHAIAGAGNPRHPLDGVGSRLNSNAIEDWILGTGAAAEQLSVTVRRRKERFQMLPAEDLHALVVYMVSLKSDDRTGPER